MSETFSVKADVASGENKGYGCSAPVGGSNPLCWWHGS